MNYKETVEFLYNNIPMFQNNGANAYKPGLENIETLDSLYGNPHKNFPTIHIAGTNGKGSVTHMTASILQEAGYKTGMFTSPHLKDFRERIKINGKMIPEEEVTGFVEKFKKNLAGKIEPSFFEITTEMAFSYFAKEKVDIAVIETGLGGRLDSTNIIHPIACAITNITFDHMAQLGNTIEKIAYEKAGIIKNGIPVVTGKMFPEAKKIIEEKAKKESAEIYNAEEEFPVTETNISQKGLIINTDSSPRYENILCALPGLYQKENIETTLTLCNKILTKELNITQKNIIDGIANVIKNTGLRGRWETISENPHIICDTGHNTAGISFITKQLALTPHNNLHIIFGMLKDKDVESVIKLLPEKATYYFTKAKSNRALDEKILQDIALKAGLHGKYYKNITEAMEAAKRNYKKGDLIYVGGSTYLVAELL